MANHRVGVSHCWSRVVSECGAAFSHGLDPQRKWKFAYGARSFEATIVPSGGSVPESASTLSDLIFCWLIHCALPPSTACPGGACGGRKGKAVQAATLGTTR